MRFSRPVGVTVWRPQEPLPGSLGHREGDYMLETLSFIEMDRQHLELLPARTVMSMFVTDGTAGNDGTSGTGGNTEGTASTATTDPTAQLMQIASKVPVVGVLLFPKPA